jgi:hypothetical protein
MASQLSGLQRQLRWQDFGNPRPGNAPAAGTYGTAAQTRSRPRRSVNAEHVPGTRPPEFRLADNVNVSVELTPGQVWVMAWVFNQPTAFQDSLLHHEQGHYNLVALLCRDMFIDLMDLKTRTFSTAQAVMAEVQRIFGIYDPPMSSVHSPYDNDTRHGTIAGQQQRWDGFIQSAFTQARVPAASAPDGTPYKVPLLTCLRNGGVSI